MRVLTSFDNCTTSWLHGVPSGFALGGTHVDPPFTLAPMAGHTHAAYRALVRQQGGCGLTCTELVSSAALAVRGSRARAQALFDWHHDDGPVAVQLFGADAHEVAEAARVVADHGATLIDINMGCWVPKVAKKGGGAALLRDVCTAQAVVAAVVRAVDVPVTVKVRAGWAHGETSAIPLARAAADVGAVGIAVHARTAAQGFSGAADWAIIAAVKDAVPGLLVIGNGDVTTAADAARMVAETGCDGVMIGRGALGAPWVFRHIWHTLTTGEVLPWPSRAERAAFALAHARLFHARTALPPHVAALELRGQLAVYDLDVPGARTMRAALTRASTLAEVEALLTPLLAADGA